MGNRCCIVKTVAGFLHSWSQHWTTKTLPSHLFMHACTWSTQWDQHEWFLTCCRFFAISKHSMPQGWNQKSAALLVLSLPKSNFGLSLLVGENTQRWIPFPRHCAILGNPRRYYLLFQGQEPACSRSERARQALLFVVTMWRVDAEEWLKIDFRVTGSWIHHCLKYLEAKSSLESMRSSQEGMKRFVKNLQGVYLARIHNLPFLRTRDPTQSCGISIFGQNNIMTWQSLLHRSSHHTLAVWVNLLCCAPIFAYQNVPPFHGHHDKFTVSKSLTVHLVG